MLTTLYCKACTGTSQYYFVPQSLHKARPSTTLHCKACTNYFPVLLCATKLARSTSQYYFVLQGLHKVFPSTEEEPKRPQPHPPHTGGLQPLYTEKWKVSCSGFLPKTKPMQHSCGHYNAFRSIPSQTCTYLRTWQHQMTTIMQPLHERIVMWCQVSHHSLTPPVIAYILMWCQVWHHSLTPPFIECILMWFQVSHHSLTPPFIECILMWCQVSHHPSLSVLLQVKVIGNSEDCFPTSFDYVKPNKISRTKWWCK